MRLRVVRSGRPVASPPAAGDLSADELASLYERHRTSLYWFCLRRTHDPLLAEDIVQDVFEAALRNRAQFDRRRPFWPWLAAIALRDCVDVQRRRHYAESRLPEVARGATEPGDFTTAAVLRSFERARLEQDLRTLPVRQRTALQLFAVDGWTYAQIAEHLGCTVAGVKGLIVRARERLREVRGRGLAAAFGAWRSVRARLHHVVSRLHFAGPMTDGALGGLHQLLGGAAPAAALLVALATSPAAPLPSERVTARAAGTPLRAGPSALAPHEIAARSDGPTVADSRRPEGSAPPPSGLQSAEHAANEALAPVLYQPPPGATPDAVLASSVAVSPNYDEDPAIYVRGDSHIGRAPPLLVSHDGGASWSTRRAVGLGAGGGIVLPPSFPRDSRIFSLNRSTLQVSYDDGHSFQRLLAVPVSDFAVSPAFDDGDATMLVVTGGRLFRYRDDGGALTPVALDEAHKGWLAETVDYAPGYPLDPTVLVGMRSPSSALGYSFARCTEDREPVGALGRAPFDGSLTCERSRMRVLNSPKAPELRSSPRLGSELLFVVPAIQDELYVSDDGGRTFREVVRPGLSPSEHMWIDDVHALPTASGRSAVMARSSYFASPESMRSGSPLARTDDGGRTWQPMQVDVANFGAARAVGVTPTGRIVVVGTGDDYRGGGIACSADQGRTWGRTCPTPEAAP